MENMNEIDDYDMEYPYILDGYTYSEEEGIIIYNLC